MPRGSKRVSITTRYSRRTAFDRFLRQKRAPVTCRCRGSFHYLSKNARYGSRSSLTAPGRNRRSLMLLC